VDYKQQLDKAKEIEKREHKIQQSRDDASTIQHLKTLNDELSKLSVVPNQYLSPQNCHPRH
jgi:flagellin-like hook-associated protein FlgL